MDDALSFVILGMASAAISVTISKSNFGRPLRQFADHLHPVLGELMSCYYCLGHWIAPALVLGHGFWQTPLDIFTRSFAVVGLSALLAGGIIVLKRAMQSPE